VPLLARVGLSQTQAASVVRWRDANGAFASRADLLKVICQDLNKGGFALCGGNELLDMTGVHLKARWSKQSWRTPASRGSRADVMRRDAQNAQTELLLPMKIWRHHR
jgi:transcriptional accessory protein Tex/SPT6